MDFPRFVFTAPGPLECMTGTYGELIVNDQSEYDAVLEAGYCTTLPEALDAINEVTRALDTVKSDDVLTAKSDAITLLKEQASELDIKIDPKWGEKRIATEIAKSKFVMKGTD